MEQSCLFFLFCFKKYFSLIQPLGNIAHQTPRNAQTLCNANCNLVHIGLFFLFFLVQNNCKWSQLFSQALNPPIGTFAYVCCPHCHLCFHLHCQLIVTLYLEYSLLCRYEVHYFDDSSVLWLYSCLLVLQLCSFGPIRKCMPFCCRSEKHNFLHISGLLLTEIKYSSTSAL